MNPTSDRKKTTMPVRHIAITGSNAKSSRRLKLLLKNTSYYCLVDCYKSSDELVGKENFHLPDCIIIEIRTLCAVFSVGRKIQNLKEFLPNTKLLLYYNMLTRHPLLEQKYAQYPLMHFRDDEQEQLLRIEHVLKHPS